MGSRFSLSRAFVVAALCLPMQACGQKNTDIDLEVQRLYKGTVPVMPIDGLSHGKVVVVDAREREEFDVSHLPEAIWVGYGDFQLSRLKDVGKQDSIVVYCSIGYRSERVGEKLLKAGYVNVFNLYGGVFQWKNSGRAVIMSNGDTTDRVHCYNRNWSRFLLKGEKVF